MENFISSLTFGVLKYLENISCVTHISISEKHPVAKARFDAWEKKYECILPKETKDIYSATDGFELRWSIKMRENEFREMGKMQVNSLDKLVQIFPRPPTTKPHFPTIVDISTKCEKDAARDKVSRKKINCEKQNRGMKKNKSDKSPENHPGVSANKNTRPLPNIRKDKIFIIDNCHDFGKVCFVYSNEDVDAESPTVWFQDLGLEWHYLCPNVTWYIRLSLIHLGIHQWQYSYTPWKAPLRVRQLLAMFIPSAETLDERKRKSVIILP